MKKHTEYTTYNQNCLEPTTLNDLLAAFDRVWKKEAVQKAKIEGNPDKEDVRKIIRRRIIENSPTITRNINEVKLCAANKSWIRHHSIVSIDDLIEELGGDDILKECYTRYYDEAPTSLFKYVPYKHACSCIINSHFKCGTANEYQKQDPRDSISLLDCEEVINEDEFYDSVLGEITSDMLNERNISLEDKRKTLNKQIGKLHYIGCLSDDPNSKYLWDNYGTGGVCIEFDVSGMNLHRVTYSDTPLDPSYIRNRFRIVSEIAEFETSKNVKKKFADLLRLIGAMGLLNLYRKDWKYHVESEWRLLVEPSKLETEKGKRFMSAPIIRVISDLPEDKDAKLREYCEGKIRYERRNCP